MTDPQQAPLRILALSPTSLVSGAERVLIDYGRDGVRRGEQWSLACPPGPLVDLINQAGIQWIATPSLRLTGGSKARSVLGLLRRNLTMTRLLRQHADEFDVVVANSVMSLPALVPARTTLPVCWLVHDVITRRDLRTVARFGARAVTLAIGVSDASAAFPKQAGIKTTVARNGVAWPVAPASTGEDPPVIGINAVLTQWKGHQVFLEALARVDQPFSAEILGGTFPGDAPYAAKLRQLATDLNLNDRVRFLGHSDDPLQAMRSWSIAVSASIEPEAGPLSVMEAMSIGLPVVVTDHGGAPEVSHGVGIAVPPRDADALAGALSALLADPDRREKLGSLGRAKVADLYSIDRSRQLFASIVSDAAGVTAQ